MSEPGGGVAYALRKRLLVRLAAAVAVLAIGLSALVWLNATAPSISSAPVAVPNTSTATPAVATGAVANPVAQPNASDASKAEPLAVATDAGEQRRSEPDAEQAAPPAPAQSAPATAQPAAASEPEAAAGKAPAAPKQKLPRGPHLQAGVFAQAANAEELRAKLEADGLPVYVESRVQIGPFKTRKEAEKMREKLKAEGVTTVLIAQ